MKKNWKSLSASVLAAAGLVATLGAPLMAQQTTVEKSKSTYSSSKSSKTSTATAGTSDQASADTLFMKRALAVGIAEIEFGQVALQNSTAEKVKDFAQKMIEDHTTANNKLSAILNGTQEESSTASGTTTNNNSKNSTGTGMGTGTGTGTGIGTSVDSVGTGMGTSMSSDSSGAAKGMGTMSDSLGTRSGIGADSSTTIPSSTTTDATSTQVQEPLKPATTLKLSGSYLDIKNKMEQVSGPAFDKQYVEQTVKDHNLSIKLLEKYQQEGSNPQLKAWVSEQLPIIRHHKAAAAKLAGASTKTTTIKKTSKS